jgi:PAS domain S-box-containing protein
MVDATTGQVEYLSPAFDRTWGVSRIAMLGPRSKWLDITHPDDRHIVETAYQRAKAGQAGTVEYRLLRADGSLRSVRDTFFPVRDGQAEVRRVAGIAQDITPESGHRVYLVAPDDHILSMLRPLLREGNFDVKAFPSVRSFLDVAPVLSPGCVLLALGANGAEGFGILSDLKPRRTELPIIVVGDAHSGIELAVRTMRAGAIDFLEASEDRARILSAVAAALVRIDEAAQQDRFVVAARARVAELSGREREVLEKIVAGGTNKTIARELSLSPRTVEAHRARVMERLGATTVQEVVLMAAAAGIGARTSNPFRQGRSE